MRPCRSAAALGGCGGLGYDPWLISRSLHGAPPRHPAEVPDEQQGLSHRMNVKSAPRISALPAPPLREYYSRVLAYIAIAASIAAGTYTQHFSYDILWMVPYGLRYPGLAGLIALSSAVFILAMIEAKPNVHTPALVALVSIAFTTLYICITAYFVHQQGLRLAQVRSKISRKQEKATRLARNLAKYLSPQVWESIFTGKKSVRLETQRKKLTVFFSDIKGFTELSEELEAEALTDLLNTYLNEMSKICLKYRS